MKTFQTIQEWLKSNPSKEEVTKILDSINRSRISEAKREVFFKGNQLTKMDRMIQGMTKIGFTISAEVKTKRDDLANEIKEMQKLIPASKPKEPKVKKEEEPIASPNPETTTETSTES